MKAIPTLRSRALPRLFYAGLASLLGLLSPTLALAVDSDGDGIDDLTDNCPLVMNMDQANHDNDPDGDACDNDDDNDGIADATDNCPLVNNAGQIDADLDGVGSVCDNCVHAQNPGQEDNDADGEGDACELGAPCAMPINCASMYCVDGTCCDAVCQGECFACKAAETVAGKDGVCSPRLATYSLKAECVGNAVVRSTCDGAGGVSPFTVEDCGSFACAASQCSMSCAGAADCAEKAYCDINSSQCMPKKATGEACGAPEECIGGYCEQNICAAEATPPPTPISGCAPDGHTFQGANSTSFDCAPYACKNDQCLLSCHSIEDCVDPFLCDSTGHCTNPPTIEPGELSCAISFFPRAGFPRAGEPGGPIAGAIAGLFASAVAVAARRRLRRRRDDRV